MITVKELSESETAMQKVVDFINEVLSQKPCRPDYWSSCPQCEHNKALAEEISDEIKKGKS